MRRDARLDTALLALAVLPYVLATLLIQPNVAPVADHAVLEMYVRETKNSLLTFGPYSRFGWHHPGPAMFYILAPFYWLISTKNQIGLMIGAGTINIASAVLIVRSLFDTNVSVEIRRLIAVVLLAVAGYVSFQTLTDPWNPFITLIPFLLFLVLAARVGAGSIASLLPTAIVASFIVQSHIGYAPVVATVLMSATIGAYSYGIRVRRTATIGRSMKISQALLSVTLIACWVPVLIGELEEGENGNLHRTVRFVAANVSGHGLSESISVVVQQWSKVLLYNLGVSDSDFPFGIHKVLAPRESYVYLFLFFVIIFGLSIAFVAAHRKGEAFIRALAANSFVGICCAVFSVEHIIGDVNVYLVIWIAIVGALGCVPLLWLFTEYTKKMRLSPSLKYVIYLIFVSGIIVRADWNRRIENDRGPIVQDVVARIFTSKIGNPLTVAISTHELWPIAAGTMLQLDKLGLRTRAEGDWGFMFGPWKMQQGDEKEKIEFWVPVDLKKYNNVEAGDFLYESEYMILRRSVVDSIDVEYRNGWGHPEEWGRFAIESVAVVSVPVATDGDTVLVEVTAFPEMNRPQELTVRVDSEPPRKFTIEGESWKWRQIHLPIGAVAGTNSERRYAQLRFEFAHFWTVGGTDTRTLALPFRRIVSKSMIAPNPKNS